MTKLCQNENKTYGDIEYLGKGTFSYVLAVGDKVLKIGIKLKQIPTVISNKTIVVIITFLFLFLLFFFFMLNTSFVFIF